MEGSRISNRKDVALLSFSQASNSSTSGHTQGQHLSRPLRLDRELAFVSEKSQEKALLTMPFVLVRNQLFVILRCGEHLKTRPVHFCIKEMIMGLHMLELDVLEGPCVQNLECDNGEDGQTN